MLNDKQVRGFRQWTCTNCNITLGFTDGIRLALRERGGRVIVDITMAQRVERKCSKCGTINALESQFSAKAVTPPKFGIMPEAGKSITK